MIKNDEDLLKVFSGTIREIVRRVVLDMLYVLEDYIVEYTYGELPNHVYYNKTGYPTYQFLDAFTFSNINQKLNKFISKLYYDWQSMDYDPNTLLHGDPESGDLRQELADILNTDSDLDKPRKPYWDIFITEMFDKHGIENLFDKYTKSEFGKIGISVIKR